MNLGAVVTGGMMKPLPEMWLRTEKGQGGDTLASPPILAGVPHADPGPGGLVMWFWESVSWGTEQGREGQRAMAGKQGEGSENHLHRR